MKAVAQEWIYYLMNWLVTAKLRRLRISITILVRYFTYRLLEVNPAIGASTTRLSFFTNESNRLKRFLNKWLTASKVTDVMLALSLFYALSASSITSKCVSTLQASRKMSFLPSGAKVDSITSVFPFTSWIWWWI